MSANTDHRLARCPGCSTRATVIVHPTGEVCPAAAEQADTMRRATGSVSATYTVEQRNADGTLTTLATGSA